MFVKVCCISNPLCVPVAATYENEHGFKPRRQGILANFWEAVYKEIMTNSTMAAEEKARRYADMPEWADMEPITKSQFASGSDLALWIASSFARHTAAATLCHGAVLKPPLPV